MQAHFHLASLIFFFQHEQHGVKLKLTLKDSDKNTAEET